MTAPKAASVRAGEQVRHTLERQQLGVVVRSSAEYSAAYDSMIVDLLCHRLTAFVLTEKVVGQVHTLSVEVPATWWQHLKASRMRPWILRRWPVRYHRIERDVRFDKRLMYPAASQSLPSLGGPIVFESLKNSGPRRWP
jgi:hypothetical protein